MKKYKNKTSQIKQQKFPHFPFENPPFPLSMGLLKVPEQEWFEIFDQKERFYQMKEKRKHARLTGTIVLITIYFYFN